MPAGSPAACSSTVTLTADTTIIAPGDPGYEEQDPGDWSTVTDSQAYGGTYRETSAAGASATYTFSGLAPGTYELWVQYTGDNQGPINFRWRSTTAT